MIRIFFVLLFLVSFNAFSQRKVTGKVYLSETKESIIMAYVQEIDGEQVATNFDGEFQLVTTKDTSKIVIKSHKMIDQVIDITSDTSLNIYLDFESAYGYASVSSEPAINESMIKWLHSIREDDIAESEINIDNEIYRFIWMRTFSNPVYIELLKNKIAYQLTYKIGKGASGYSPSGLKKKKTKSVTSDEWNYFKSLLKQTYFDTIPNRHYEVMIDGVSWFFEKKTTHQYKGHYTNVPDSLLITCGLYLLELAGIEFEKLESSNDYSRNRIYLNVNSEIISRVEINKLLLTHLNEYFSKTPPKSDWCYYPNNKVLINRKGKVTKVKSLTGSGLALDIAYFFEDWECRNTYRKAFKSIDLSGLDLKHKISVYLTGSFDKVNKIIYHKE